MRAISESVKAAIRRIEVTPLAARMAAILGPIPLICLTSSVMTAGGGATLEAALPPGVRLPRGAAG